MKNYNKHWQDDNLQFARLLSEIYACGLNEYQYVDLCESMSLTKEEINNIFDRAESAFNIIKLENM